MKLRPLPKASLKNAKPSRSLSGLHHLGMGLANAGFWGMSCASGMMVLAIGIPALGIIIPAVLPVSSIIILATATAFGTSAAGAILAAITAKDKDTLPELKARQVNRAGGVIAVTLGLSVTGYKAPDFDHHFRSTDAFTRAAQGYSCLKQKNEQTANPNPIVPAQAPAP